MMSPNPLFLETRNFFWRFSRVMFDLFFLYHVSDLKSTFFLSCMPTPFIFSHPLPFAFSCSLFPQDKISVLSQELLAHKASFVLSVETLCLELQVIADEFHEAGGSVSPFSAVCVGSCTLTETTCW